MWGIRGSEILVPLYVSSWSEHVKWCRTSAKNTMQVWNKNTMQLSRVVNKICVYVCMYEVIGNLQFFISFELQTAEQEDENENNKANCSKYHSIHYPPVIV